MIYSKQHGLSEEGSDWVPARIVELDRNAELAVLKRVFEDTPKPVREVNPEVPEWLCDIVEKLLEKRPEDRFQPAREVADLLNGHLVHLQQPEANPQPARLSPSARQADERTRSRLKVVRDILAILGGLSIVWVVAMLITPHARRVGLLLGMPAMPSQVLSLIVAGLTLNGSRHVARRRSYAWTIVASVALMLPVNPVWVVAVPLSMMALATLMRRDVKAAFGIRPQHSSIDDRTVVTGSTPGAPAGDSTLFARCHRRYRDAHNRWGDAAIIVALLRNCWRSTTPAADAQASLRRNVIANAIQRVTFPIRASATIIGAFHTRTGLHHGA